MIGLIKRNKTFRMSRGLKDCGSLVQIEHPIGWRMENEQGSLEFSNGRGHINLLQMLNKLFFEKKSRPARVTRACPSIRSGIAR
jgi:hypothetical protein